MKKFALLGLMCITSVSFAQKMPVINDESSDRAQIGYSFGYLIGKNNAQSLKDIDLDSFFAGFRQGYQGEPSTLSQAQMEKILTQYKKNLEASQLNHFKAEANDNLARGQAFLASNAKKENIITTASGLQYQILKQGTGAKPTTTSQVKVNYEGRLIDGTVFDSSIARDEPVTLPLNKVIKGWAEGVQLMKEGSKYRFFIPANLAYGETGAGPIPPNSTLIFDIDLIKIVK